MMHSIGLFKDVLSLSNTMLEELRRIATARARRPCVQIVHIFRLVALNNYSTPLACSQVVSRSTAGGVPCLLALSDADCSDQRRRYGACVTHNTTNRSPRFFEHRSS